MATLKQRLARLEKTAHRILPSQQECPACGGREQMALSDEPDNTGPPLPYDGPGGVCRLCRMPPPGKRILQLPAEIAEYFTKVPWSDEPRLRFLEKMSLLMAITKSDREAATREVESLIARDENGVRHCRWPELRRESGVR